MLRSLKEVRADDSVVGFYQSTTMGAFYSQTIIDAQAIHQEKLRQGGVVVLHGNFYFVYKNARSETVIVLDRYISG